jgi:hypothetical protein
MKTFDMAGAVDDVKTHAFEISNDIRDRLAAAKTSAPMTVNAPNFDSGAFNSQLDNAFRAEIEAHLPKPEPFAPELRDTLKAAFQSGNVIGSAITSQTMAERVFATVDSPEMTDDQILDAVGKANMLPNLQRFSGVTNEAQFTARRNDIDREQKNLAIIEASGWTGTGAMLVAGLIDLPTLIPVGRAYQLGRKGASLLEATARTAAAGATDAAISEVGLQATQQLRTKEDAALSIASGAILGGVLGAGIHKLVGDSSPKIEASLDAYRRDALNGFPEARARVDELDAEYKAANGYKPAAGTEPTAKSAGAMAVDKAELAAIDAAHGKLADAKVSAMYLDKIPSITTAPTEYLSKIIGGKTLLGRPRDAFRTSELSTVRKFRRMFYSSPEISEANVAGRADFRGMTVEDHIGEDMGKLSEFKATVENVYAANKTRFKDVNDLAERAYNAALNEGIDKIGADPAVEAVGRAFNKYAEYQHAKHVKNGKLPEDTAVMGTPGGYVRRSYNQTALRAKEGTAREMLFRWAKRKVTADVEEVLADTGYSAKMKAYEDAVAGAEDRMSFWEKHPERLVDWEHKRDTVLLQDRADFETASSAWKERVAEFLSDPSNDGKKHPFALQKPKVSDYTIGMKNFEAEFGPRPRKGDKPTKTDGNPKPALPKNKYGMPMLPEHIDAYAQALADDVYNTLAGVKSAIPRAAPSRVNARQGYLKGRVVDIPDEALAEEFFLKTNLLDHAETMHYTSGRDASLGSVFKAVDKYGNEVGDYDGNTIVVAIEKEAQDAIDTATGEAKTRLIDERDRMMAGVQNEIAISRGAFNSGNGLIGPNAAHSLASAAYAVRLGGVTVSSLTDAPKVALAHGLGNTFRYGVMPMLTDFRAAMRRGGAMRDQGVRVGAVTEVLHNTRMADVFELNNPHSVGDKWSNFVDKSTKLATQISLISHWTDFGKQVSHNITSSRIINYALMGEARVSSKNIAWLANLGIESSDLLSIKDAYSAQTTKHVAGVLYADLDKWADANLAARFSAAFRREGRNVVVAPGLGDRPQFMHTVEGKLIYQFQTFMLTDQIRFMARQAQLANVAGDASEKMRQRVALGAGMSSLILSAVFVDSMKRALRENDADWEAFTKRWQDNPGGSMYDAIDRAGVMGSVFGASNTAGKFSNGQFSIRGGTQWLTGDKDRGEARKVRDIGLGGAVLGPVAGIAEDLVKLGQAAGKVAGGGDLNRADIRRFQNTVPYHAVPGIQQALNALNGLSASALGLPPEAKR